MSPSTSITLVLALGSLTRRLLLGSQLTRAVIIKVTICIMCGIRPHMHLGIQDVIDPPLPDPADLLTRIDPPDRRAHLE